MRAGCGQQAPQELWQEAQTAIAAGDYRAASIHLKNLFQQDAGNLEALVLLADIALANGDPRSAELQYRRAARRGATDDQVRVGLLESLIELQRYQDVLDEVESIDEAGLAERPAILKRRGRAYAGMGRLDDAVKDFQRAADLEPGAVDTPVYLAEVYRAMGRQDAADGALDRALQIDPDYPAALLQKGIRELAADQQSVAEATFRHAAQVAQQRIAAQRFIEQRDTARAGLSALYQLANLQLEQNRPDDAAATVRQLTELAPGAVTVTFLNARLALQNEDTDTAKRLLQGVLSEHTDFQPAQRLLGMIYGLEGNYNLADMYLTPYIRAHPEDTAARRILIDVLLQQDRYDEAVALLREAPDGVGDEVAQGVLALAGAASV